MKRFFLTLAAILGFSSQAGSKTQITLDQLVAPTTAGVMVDVVGKGWTYAAIDSTLTIDTTTTPPTLRSNGGGQPNFVDGASLTGTVDGVNTVFTLPSVPNPPSSLFIEANGLVYRASGASGPNFTLSGATVTFSFAPGAGWTLLATYRR